MPHLFVDISSHGLGHLAQVAPILNEVTRRFPSLRLTLRSGVPAERLRARVHGDFTHIAQASDFGYVMIDATRIGHTLGEHGKHPAADSQALEDALLGISNMVCELPALDTLEINPLVVDADGCLAVDARLSIDPSRGAGQGRVDLVGDHDDAVLRRQPRDLRQLVGGVDGADGVVRRAQQRDSGG